MQLYMQMDGIKLSTTLLVSILLLSYLFSVSYPPPLCQGGSPPTLYVGPDEIHTTINSALENASDGYRIIVYGGTYNEQLIINKRIDLFGEDKTVTTINGNDTGTTITINTAYVNISHFTITNGGTNNQDALITINNDHAIITDNTLSNGNYGIILNQSHNHLIYDNAITNNNADGLHLIQSNNNVNISYNTITNNDNGIYLYSSDGNKIFNNHIQTNTQHGLFINHTCDNNQIKNNNISDNTQHGIYLNDYSHYSTLSNNQLYSNSNSGLVLENCSFTTINNHNTIQSNTNYGIMLVGSNNNIQTNTITHNNKDGLYLTADDNNTIQSNTIHHNLLAGIRLYNSTQDYLLTNTIYNNHYGTYLDFFTKQNRIYNNYFHNNTINAMDKSQDSNTWNITKTTGTNIIGGPYLAGNYWDDFDEPSEGALDNNSDGIVDNDDYTIYAQNQDHAPILDVTPPTIGTPQATPQEQTIGGTTTIQATVTDNTEVRNVYLHVTTPRGTTQNITITQNRTGTTYSCTKQYTLIGNYTYHIAATDPRNWQNSTNKTFTITEGTPPTITDNTPTTAEAKTSFTFNATVTDDEDPPSLLTTTVTWNHGKKNDTDIMEHTTGNYFEKTITLDSSLSSLTYTITAMDQWDNTITTTQATVTITDTQPPKITIKQHGPSFETMPGSYTFAATITDNVKVNTVRIDYWYNGSTNMTATMKKTSSTYYEKTILPQGNPGHIYCVIYANDTSGNQANTKTPTAKTGGSYRGVVLSPVTFNGTQSYDLDGTITTYTWDFGDGTTANDSITTHTYLADGNYTIKLTVTDNNGRTNTATTHCKINAFSKIDVTQAVLDNLSTLYDINLREPFYCFDSDGDDIPDTFYDPNDILTPTHTDSVTLNSDTIFLLSTQNDPIPEFFWNVDENTYTPITHFIGTIYSNTIDEETEQATLFVIIQKATWVYIEIDDPYPYATLTIKADDRQIPSELIWRTNNKIYLLDDPEVIYQYHFQNIYPILETPKFTPKDSAIINQDQPTITITYNVPVTITYASFGNQNIINQLKTTDNKQFTYSPPAYLKNGTYQLEIDAQAQQGTSYITARAQYLYFSWGKPPQPSLLDLYGTWILTGIGIACVALFIFLLKTKRITINDFIYLKNQKILPFFKTIIVGPLSIRIADESIKKAEFYIDGELKETLDKPPFYWQWSEQAFMKHTVETKIFDQGGNDVSSGEMEFYIFNPSLKR